MSSPYAPPPSPPYTPCTRFNQLAGSKELRSKYKADGSECSADGTDCASGDHSTFSTDLTTDPDRENCCTKCLDEPGCTGFVALGQTCYLKQGDLMSYDNDGRVAYLRHPDPPPLPPPPQLPAPSPPPPPLPPPPPFHEPPNAFSLIGGAVGLVVAVVISVAIVMGCIKRAQGQQQQQHRHAPNLPRPQFSALSHTTSPASHAPGNVEMVSGVVQAVLVGQATPVVGSTSASPMASSLPLIEQVAILKRELGVSGNIRDAVHEAAKQLGIQVGNRPISEISAQCMQALGAYA